VKLKLAKNNKANFTILGFRRIDRPNYADTLVFPAQTLTSLDSEQVSDLHAKYTLLYAYANQSLAEINVEILRLQNKRGERENEIYRRNTAINSLEKWRRDAKMKEDTAIERLNFALTQEHFKRIQLEAILGNYERFIAALSRELSRKNFERNPQGY
jgi:hypothetical protein